MSEEPLGPASVAEQCRYKDWQPALQRPRTPSITDGIEDLLDLLDPQKRRGMIAWLSAGYYDGWRPGRHEIADLVAIEIGLLTVDEYVQRQRQRGRAAETVTDIAPLITQRLRRSSRR